MIPKLSALEEEKKSGVVEYDFFERRLDSFLNMRHELVILSDKIDWDFLYGEFSGVYCSNNGRPAANIRLMTGLLILKAVYKLSDEDVVAKWV